MTRKMMKNGSIMNLVDKMFSDNENTAKEIKARHIDYHPNSEWLEPPLSAWIPNSNLPAFTAYVTFVTTIVLLARFTSFCGVPQVGKDKEQFCSDNWLFANDHILKFISAGMFFLVAFRASNSYSKYWEGRCVWGKIWKVSRDMAHLMSCHIQVETAKDELEMKRMIAFIAAIPITTKSLLRNEPSIRDELKELLSDFDIQKIDDAIHSPNYCIDVIGHYLAKQTRLGHLSDHQLQVLNQGGIMEMSASVGALERLRNSFIPVIYTLHQRMIIIIWLVLLSFHFLSKFWWYTIPLGTVVAYIILGIDSMSCEIEEPFGYDQNDLDLTRFCKGIVRDTQDIYNRRALLAAPIVVQLQQSRQGDRKKKNLELVHEADKQIKIASDFGFSRAESARPMSTASSVFIRP